MRAISSRPPTRAEVERLRAECERLQTEIDTLQRRVEEQGRDVQTQFIRIAEMQAILDEERMAARNK